RGRVDEDVVHVVAALAPDLERVAEAGRREESRPRALPLDQRVGGERRAVGRRADVARGDPPVLEQRLDALLDAVGRVLGRGEHLAGAERPGRPDQGEGGGDRPADIDTKPRRHEGSLPSVARDLVRPEAARYSPGSGNKRGWADAFSADGTRDAASDQPEAGTT